MNCPRCSETNTRVADSRDSADGRTVRRRRFCERCEFRFTTFERIEEMLPLIVKKGGQRENFDPLKILGGLKKACEKRPVSVEQMENLIRDVELKLLEMGEKEIQSQLIGEIVIEKLQELDQVAYVRFASVYREFSDVVEFLDTLKNLVSSKDLKSLKQNAKKRAGESSSE